MRSTYLRARAVCSEVVGSGAARGGFVVGVQEVALVDREAAATDARGESVAQALQRLDARVEVVSPAVREAFPVLAAGRAASGQARERRPDVGEGDARGSAGLDEGNPAQDGAVVAALVAVGAGGLDQALAFVEAQRRGRDAASLRHLADRELAGHLT